MKQTTINRFREWAKTSEPGAVFSAGSQCWTKEEFSVAFLGEKPKKTAKPINIDVKVNEDADMEPTFETRHTEES